MLNSSSLPVDDLPPTPLTEGDRRLFRSLTQALTRKFYEACDGVTQAILINCQWSISLPVGGQPLLAICCPDFATNTRLLHHLGLLAQVLGRFSPKATIQIQVANSKIQALEVQVDRPDH